MGNGEWAAAWIKRASPQRPKERQEGMVKIGLVGIGNRALSKDGSKRPVNNLKRKKSKPLQRKGLDFSRGDMIRTCDFLVPNQAL